MSSDSWSCDRCTFSNSVGVLCCDMCGAAPPTPERRALVASMGGSWACEICTAENPNSTSVCQACEVERKEPLASTVPPVARLAPIPGITLTDECALLSYQAPKNESQAAIEKERYAKHLETVAKYKQAEAAAAGPGVMGAVAAAPKWKPTREEDWCNTLVHGPGAPACCPKSQQKWNGWKCLRCGNFMEFPAGACPSGCSWSEWGWVCVYHEGGYGRQQ